MVTCKPILSAIPSIGQAEILEIRCFSLNLYDARLLTLLGNGYSYDLAFHLAFYRRKKIDNRDEYLEKLLSNDVAFIHLLRVSGIVEDYENSVY